MLLSSGITWNIKYDITFRKFKTYLVKFLRIPEASWASGARPAAHIPAVGGGLGFCPCGGPGSHQM